MKKLLGFIVKLIVSLVFAVLIYLWSNYDIIATVLSFFIGTILIDFIGNRRIMHNKIKYKYESSLQSVGRREGLTAGEIDWEVSATEKDG